MTFVYLRFEFQKNNTAVDNSDFQGYRALWLNVL